MTDWSKAEKDRLATLWDAMGGSVRKIARVMHRTPGSISGQSMRMHLHYPAAGAAPLAADHPAAVIGRSLFPSKVRPPDAIRGVLKPGSFQRKLGSRVLKGPWKGMPIFSLTLEERATCPRSCQQWFSCYTDRMGMAVRYQHGRELEYQIARELAILQIKRPAGFVVRLHIGGDFYSVTYVAFWERALNLFPGLHIFGYTARQHDDPIGAAVAKLRDERWDRFAVRTSGAKHGPRTEVVDSKKPSVSAIVCPAQTGKSSHCGNCALCWSTPAKHRPIAFLQH